MFPKIGDIPKVDGENHGKPYFLMDDLGVPQFLETSMFFYMSPTYEPKDVSLKFIGWFYAVYGSMGLVHVAYILVDFFKWKI